MVRPGLKRLQEAQRVKVQPNKTGTSVMLGRSSFLNNRKRTVVFNESAGTAYNELKNSKDFVNEYTISQKVSDISCNCIGKTVYAKDVNGNIIPYK